MFTVNINDLTKTAEGFSCFASDMGMRPGIWPDFVAVMTTEKDGYLYMKGQQTIKEGDLLYIDYYPRNGKTATLRIFND